MKPVLLFLTLSGLAATAYALDPAATWTEHCAKCHGEDASGNTKMGKKFGIKDYTTAQAQAEFTDAQAIAALKDGAASKTGKTHQKPIEGLSDADLQALVTHLRSLKK